MQTVSFALCPSGYCCDDDADSEWPCVAIDGCAGGRVGQLCGQCGVGLVEALGSARCLQSDSCVVDVPVVWSVAVVGVLLAAWLQLAVVSDVWLASREFPSGTLKLVGYFVQVRVLV